MGSVFVFYGFNKSYSHIAQEHLPIYLGFFEFVNDAKKRSKAPLSQLLELIISQLPEIH
jgi:hypothetical protein